MALTLKTPGVYVEELSTLPPSVAQVATAVPAFIGYTFKAEKPDGTVLTNVPTRISSMLEFETYFGKAKDETGIGVTVTDNAVTTDFPQASRSLFRMYYSLQMYFANGGGPCYIVSVGGYGGGVVLTHLQSGLDTLEKEDEPTLIVFPDAISLGNADQLAIYQSALAQCNKLQDRFTIMDVKMQTLVASSIDPAADMAAFRALSSDDEHRRYGAAYYPYVNTVLDYQYADAGVTVTQTSETDYDQQVQSLGASIASNKDALAVLLDQLDDLDAELSNNATTDAHAFNDIRPQIETVIAQVIQTTGYIADTLADASDIARAVLAANIAEEGTGTYDDLFLKTNELDAWINNELNQKMVNLNTRINSMASLSTGAGDNKGDLQAFVSAATGSIFADLGMVTGPDLAVKIANLTALYPTTGTVNIVEELRDYVSSYSGPATVTGTLAALVSTNNELYNRIKAAISQIPVLLPPSAGIAGVYARVDASEGVWKAPANVSLNYVIGPNYLLSNEQQQNMNVHTAGGKSVNAIRSFTGRGTLVWGARTLDGNSNEWRYIPVRRFFNMVEESVQEATESFIFEANDANTWVKVRAMIENYLVLQWKAGALAGAKPEQAFYVRVGLGQTMTADDVLNGRMIVEIGMAVVRPAEFIVLRFSHMMQQA
jgi:uncharacterized protein